jgi:pimeloyl-ACP methyl ester carboxylesterase
MLPLLLLAVSLPCAAGQHSREGEAAAEPPALRGPSVSKAAKPSEAPKPIIVVVGGVGGLENLKLSLQWALHLAGLDAEVRNFEWTHGKGHIIKDLQDTRNHADKTDELVHELRRLKADAPDRPLYLVGRSGGTVLALGAAARFPPQSFERIILLSPAISPTFDLSPALRATRRELVAFCSDLDWFVLGWGTQQFGTADRYYSSSAGLKGFVPPPDATPETEELYCRLVQVHWSPSMILHGHTGGHIGPTLPTFLASDVVPWLKP